MSSNPIAEYLDVMVDTGPGKFAGFMHPFLEPFPLGPPEAEFLPAHYSIGAAQLNSQAEDLALGLDQLCGLLPGGIGLDRLTHS